MAPETLVESQSVGSLVLKLRRDVVFLPSKEGITFRNEKGMFSIKGAGVYALLSTLFQFFDGTHSLAEISEQLPPARRPAVEQLVSTLVDRGVLRHHVQEAPDLLSKAVQTRFERQLAFIEHTADRPHERFRKFRDSRVLVLGDGAAASAVLASLVRNGLKRVHAALPAGERPSADVDAAVTELAHAGVEAEVVRLAGRDVADVADVAIEGFDVVVYCSSQPALSEVLALLKRCRERGVSFLPGLVLGAHSYIGPLSLDRSTPCWCCSALRVASNAEPDLAAAIWRSLGIGTRLTDMRTPPASPACRMLGNNVAFELFKERCGHLRPETRRRVLVQSMETLETSTVPALAHPLCPVCATTAADADEGTEPLFQTMNAPAMSAQAALTRIHDVIHPQLGIIQGFRDEDLSQLPLRASRVTMGSPSGTLASTTIPAFHQESTLAARRAAVERAVKQYGASVRALLPMKRATWRALMEEGLNAVGDEDLGTWVGGPAAGPDESLDWVRVYSAVRSEFRYVPAAAVLPLSVFNASGAFARAAVGLACGTTFGEVTRAGLLSALAHERLRRQMREPGDVAVLQPEAVAALDVELEHLVQSIGRFGERPRLLELRGAGAVRVVLAGLESADHADACAYSVGAGADLEEAAFNALQPLVGSLQIASTPAALGYSAGDLVPGFAFHQGVRMSEATGIQPADPRSSAGELDFGLAGDADVLVADLTPRDLGELKTFYVGTVLLARSKERAPGDGPTARTSA